MVYFAGIIAVGGVAFDMVYQLLACNASHNEFLLTMLGWKFGHGGPTMTTLLVKISTLVIHVKQSGYRVGITTQNPHHYVSKYIFLSYCIAGNGTYVLSAYTNFETDMNNAHILRVVKVIVVMADTNG